MNIESNILIYNHRHLYIILKLHELEIIKLNELERK